MRQTSTRRTAGSSAWLFWVLAAALFALAVVAAAEGNPVALVLGTAFGVLFLAIGLYAARREPAAIEKLAHRPLLRDQSDVWLTSGDTDFEPIANKPYEPLIDDQDDNK